MNRATRKIRSNAKSETKRKHSNYYVISGQKEKKNEELYEPYEPVELRARLVDCRERTTTTDERVQHTTQHRILKIQSRVLLCRSCEYIFYL